MMDQWQGLVKGKEDDVNRLQQQVNNLQSQVSSPPAAIRSGTSQGASLAFTSISLFVTFGNCSLFFHTCAVCCNCFNTVSLT